MVEEAKSTEALPYIRWISISSLSSGLHQDINCWLYFLATMGWFFKSEFFDFEFLRVIGTAPVQGAEIGECLEAVSRIKDGNIDSWYDVWTDLAGRAKTLG
jgi:hypothetical protein